jgi:hypothetical protein
MMALQVGLAASLVSLCCGAVSAEWLPPEAVSDDLAVKYLSGWNHWGIAGDSEGNWHVVWVDNRDHDQVYYRMYVPGLGWESEEELVSIHWPASNPALAVGGQGDVHVVWWTYEGGLGEIYYRQKSANAGWDSVATRLADLGVDDWSPSVATDSSGNVHVVYTKQRVLSPEIRYLMKDPVQGWLQGYIISHGDGTESSYPTVCVDSGDNLHVAWIAGDTNGPDAEIYYLKYTTETGWDSLPTRITSDSLNTIEPCIAADGLDCIHIIWRERGGSREEVGYRGYTPGVGWDIEPTQISPEDSVFSRSPSTAADPFGGVHVVWADYDPDLNEGEVYYREFHPDSGWLEPQQVTTTPGGYAHNPDIAANGCGDLGILYESSSDANVYLQRWVDSGASVGADEIAGRSYLIGYVRPNPFGDSAELGYAVSGEGDATVRLEIFDVRGRLLRALCDGSVPPGRYSVSWDGCDEQGRRLSPGIYIARITVRSRSESHALVLIK